MNVNAQDQWIAARLGEALLQVVLAKNGALQAGYGGQMLDAIERVALDLEALRRDLK